MTATPFQIPVRDLVFDAVSEGPDDGAPALLLHGFPESSWAWRFIQPALADAGVQAVAYDQRGYSPGASPAAPEQYAIERMVHDAIGVLDHLGWDSAHVVGHDWGGVVAWHLAGRHPEKVRTLTAISTCHPQALLDARAAGPQPDGEDQSTKGSYVDFFKAEGAEEFFVADDSKGFRETLLGSGLDAESVDHYASRYDTADKVTGLLNWYRAAKPDDGTKVGPVPVPTTYVWPSDDLVFGRLAAELTAQYVTGPYELVTLDGVSHWALEEAADQLIPVILARIGLV